MFQVDEKITTKCIKKSNFIWVIEDVPILGKDSIKINGFDGMVYYQLPDYDSYKPSYKFWDFIVEEEKINVFKKTIEGQLDNINLKEKLYGKKIINNRKEFQISIDNIEKGLDINISYKFNK